MWSLRRLLLRRWIWRTVHRRPRPVHGIAVLRVFRQNRTYTDHAAFGDTTWQIGDRQVHVPAGAVKWVLDPGFDVEIRKVTP